MKKVEILRDTIVRFGKGVVIEVSDEEAARLAAFGNAKEVETGCRTGSEEIDEEAVVTR